MVSTIDMQDLRYLNLFNKITRLNTKYCFNYNNTIFFAVPRNLIKRAIGEDARNLKRMSEIIKKRVRIIAIPNDINDAKRFIESIVNPVEIKEIEIKDNEIVIGGNVQTKATLIGRNKRRLLEMQDIIKGFFKRDFRVAWF